MSPQRGVYRGVAAAAINGTEAKPVVFTFRNGTKRQFTGQSMLLTFSLPQFMFHVTTAYDILRNNGVDAGEEGLHGNAAESIAVQVELLGLAAVSAEIRPYAAIAMSVFRASKRCRGFAGALVDEGDHLALRIGPLVSGRECVADGLVDIVVAEVVAPHGPAEADGIDRAGTDFRIAIGLKLPRLRHDGRFGATVNSAAQR